jgi:tetratricopeptide (TPR) repeat protein
MQSMRSKVLASSVLCFCGSWWAPALVCAAAPASAPAKDAAEATAASAAPATTATPSPTVVTEAKQRFDRGLDLYSEGEYPLALIEFTRAYQLVPNYKVLYNIGQVGIQLGQYANARRALEEYVQKGGDTLSADRRAAVTKDLEMLERRTAFLEITVNVPGAEVLVDDVAVGKTPLSPALLVDAGVHRIVVRRAGYLQRNSQVTLAGGDRQVLPLTLDKQPEEKATIVVRERAAEKDSTLMIAGWVATGALTAGAILTGIMGAGEAKELKELRAADPRDYDNLGERLDSTKSNASSLFLASDVFSGAAIVVGGLSLWITVSPLDPSKPAPNDKPATRPGPGKPLQVGYQEGQIKVRGSF